MVMEFDQYLQPCTDNDIYYLTGYERPKTQPLKVDDPRSIATEVGPHLTGTCSPEPASEPQSEEESSPKVNRCFWACSFDNEDAETIFTSHTGDVDPCRDAVASSTTSSVEEDPEFSASSAADPPSSSGGAWSAFSAVSVDAKPCSSPPATHRSRHLSLPANLPSLLRNSDQRAAEYRRRHPSTGVRFADEIGENLSTFAIIPSRHDVDRCHQQNSASTPLRTHSSTVLGRATDNRRRLHLLDHYRAMASFGMIRADASSWLTENLSSSSLSSDDEDRDPGSRRATFRLSFDQPAADPTSFKQRLDSQMVCLENVKVVSDMALCSVRVKCLDCPQSTRRVVARCTNDNWLSFADITAHPVGVGMPRSADRNSLRSTRYETLSFAVRRPKSERSAAVEFALCYRVDERAWWDNNNGRNYRVEWLR